MCGASGVLVQDSGKNLLDSCRYLQRVVVGLDWSEVLLLVIVAGVVEGAEERLQEGDEAGGRHCLLVEVAWNDAKPSLVPDNQCDQIGQFIAL